jgi:mRNA-degrading endonuclease toxin of MazEF toxin-antitoxin module
MTPTNEKMPMANRIIKRGEVYYANLDDAFGHEQKNDKNTERRLAVVVSNNKQNEQNKVVVVVPLSSFQGKPGKVKCEQVWAIDVERLLGEKQGGLTENEMESIDKKLMVVLDLMRYWGKFSEGKRYF